MVERTHQSEVQRSRSLEWIVKAAALHTRESSRSTARISCDERFELSTTSRLRSRTSCSLSALMFTSRRSFAQRILAMILSMSLRFASWIDANFGRCMYSGFLNGRNAGTSSCTSHSTSELYTLNSLPPLLSSRDAGNQYFECYYCSYWTEQKYRENVVVAVRLVDRHRRDDEFVRVEQMEFGEKLREIPLEQRSPLLLLWAHCAEDLGFRFWLVVARIRVLSERKFAFPRVAFEWWPAAQSVEYCQQRRGSGWIDFACESSRKVSVTSDSKITNYYFLKITSRLGLKHSNAMFAINSLAVSR